MTLDERVTRLEHFMGDMEHIATLYANSVQEICDKYLSLLYVETIDPSYVNHLRVEGYLGTIGSDPNTVPRNVVFNIRASHDYEINPTEPGALLILERDGIELSFPLKKYNIDPAHQGELTELEEHDFRNGSLYGIYINSQGIAIMTTNDAGDAALSEVRRLADVVSDMNTILSQAIPSSGEVVANSVNVSNSITTKDISVTGNVSLINPITLPNGSTCANTGSPTDESTRIANTNYVWNAIRQYHLMYHKKGTGDPLADPTLMNDSPEGGLYYQY